MLYTSYFEGDSQMSKYDRFRVDYSLLWRVIQAKENQVSNPKTQSIKPTKTINK